MKAAAWIDRVKMARGWESDYRVAKELGFNPNTISNYRSRNDSLMDERIAIKVAHALDVDPAGIIIDQLAEKSKSPEVSSSLHRVASQLCILCKVIFTVQSKAAHALPMLGLPLVRRHRLHQI